MALSTSFSSRCPQIPCSRFYTGCTDRLIMYRALCPVGLAEARLPATCICEVGSPRHLYLLVLLCPVRMSRIPNKAPCTSSLVGYPGIALCSGALPKSDMNVRDCYALCRFAERSGNKPANCPICLSSAAMREVLQALAPFPICHGSAVYSRHNGNVTQGHMASIHPAATANANP